MKSIKDTLESALTQFDAKQFARTKGNRAKGYNPNALGIYFARVEEICADIANGANPRAAIVAGFMGPVQSACLKACGLDKPTPEELSPKGGAWHYVPASAK